MVNRPSRFAFVDEGEAVRRLDIDRDTLLALVRAGRLRAYPGVGKGSFYRVSEIERLAAELHGEQGAPDGGQGSADDENASTRKVFDPAYKVHVRLLADLKWYDLTDDDLAAWVRELHPDGYARQRTNITNVLERLQQLVTLMDEAAANWQSTGDTHEQTQPTPPPQPSPRKPTPRSLPVLSGAPSDQTTSAPTPEPAPAPRLLTIQRAKKRETKQE